MEQPKLYGTWTGGGLPTGTAPFFESAELLGLERGLEDDDSIHVQCIAELPIDLWPSATEPNDPYLGPAEPLPPETQEKVWWTSHPRPACTKSYSLDPFSHFTECLARLDAVMSSDQLLWLLCLAVLLEKVRLYPTNLFIGTGIYVCVVTFSTRVWLSIPFISVPGGDGFGVGSTPPGAQYPFGFMRLSPDTSEDNIVLPWRHFGGYYYGIEQLCIIHTVSGTCHDQISFNLSY